MKNKIIKIFVVMTLTMVGVFFYGLTASADTPEFRADDVQQKIILTTSMPNYDSSMGYAIHTLGFLLKITSGSTSQTVFLEGGIEHHQLRYATIISEFVTEHGSAGRTLAENYFYNGSGTMTLDTVVTLWQRGGGYSSNYNEYKCVKGGREGWVQAKINDSSHVETPTKEVHASNWRSQIKNFPVKFWTWSQKSYSWSYYASHMNSSKTSVYTLSPNTFTADTIRNYTAPHYAADWQNAAMLCEFSLNTIRAAREYYKRTIVRQNTMNFKVTEIQAPSSITEYGSVTVLYTNEHFDRGTQTVSTNLTLSGGESIDYELALDTNRYSGCYLNYTIYGYTEGNRNLTATINGGVNGYHRFPEITYADNVLSRSVYVQLLRDFGTWGLTAYNANGEMVTSYSTAKLMENSVCTFEVNWTNYRSIAQSNVRCELYLDDVLFYTDYLNFSGGYQTITKTYTKHIGWGTNNRTLKTRINYANRFSETDPYDNERSASFPVSEYKDFSIGELSISNSSVYENDEVIVYVRTDNWNLYRSYTNIPVELIYDGRVVATQYTNFSPYGVGYHTFLLNVGEARGVKELYARVNWNDRFSETNTANNRTDSRTITVSRKIDKGIVLIPPNSAYRAGTQVITSYRVHNYSRHNLLPGDQVLVWFSAYYYNESGAFTHLNDSSKGTVIPAYDSNLVYFKWYVPGEAAGREVFLCASVSSNLYDTNWNNNAHYSTYNIEPTLVSATPNTRYEDNKPTGWSPVSPPGTYGDSASWSEWSYVNGAFIHTNYGVRLSSSSSPQIIPDSRVPSAHYSNGQWVMKSGYGYSLSLYPILEPVSGTAFPAGSAYTTVQRSYAMFPEFSYRTITGFFRTLEPVAGAGMFRLPPNPDADNERLHYTPLWYPDINYIVSCYLYDFWTPAGMLTARINSNAILIDGSLYDDWYIGYGG